MLRFSCKNTCVRQKEVILLKIKDVCLRTGLTDRTIRFYIEKGLLNVNANDVNGRNYREYTEKDVELLKDISKLRKAKFSVQDIIDMQNPNGNMSDIVARHCMHLEQEQQVNEIIVQKLKEFNTLRNVSWRELANDLFCNADTNQIESTLDLNEEPIIIQYSKSFKDYLKIGIPIIILSLSLIVGSLFLFKHWYDHRDLMTSICISEVTIHDKWIADGKHFVSITTNPDTAVGYDNYFSEQRTLNVESIDYYNALMEEAGSYMSMTIEIEIPYIEAKESELIDIENHINIESVLSNQDYIRSYCTLTSVKHNLTNNR